MSTDIALPLELWTRIASLLPAPSRVFLAATCKAMHSLVTTSPSVWHTLEITPATIKAYPEFNWKSLLIVKIGEIPGFVRILPQETKRGVRILVLDGLTVHFPVLQKAFNELRQIRVLSLCNCRFITVDQLAWFFKSYNPNCAPHLTHLYLQDVIVTTRRNTHRRTIARLRASLNPSTPLFLDLELSTGCSHNRTIKALSYACRVCSAPGPASICATCLAHDLCVTCQQYTCRRCQDINTSSTSRPTCRCFPYPSSAQRLSRFQCEACQLRARCTKCARVGCFKCIRYALCPCSRCETPYCSFCWRKDTLIKCNYTQCFERRCDAQDCAAEHNIFTQCDICFAWTCPKGLGHIGEGRARKCKGLPCKGCGRVPCAVCVPEGKCRACEGVWCTDCRKQHLAACRNRWKFCYTNKWCDEVSDGADEDRLDWPLEMLAKWSDESEMTEVDENEGNYEDVMDLNVPYISFFEHEEELTETEELTDIDENEVFFEHDEETEEIDENEVFFEHDEETEEIDENEIFFEHVEETEALTDIDENEVFFEHDETEELAKAKEMTETEALAETEELTETDGHETDEM